MAFPVVARRSELVPVPDTCGSTGLVTAVVPPFHELTAPGRRTEVVDARNHSSR